MDAEAGAARMELVSECREDVLLSRMLIIYAFSEATIGASTSAA